ncbi:B-cell receptor CD22-like isoform 2-T2 [Odontesthes bonariensis]
MPGALTFLLTGCLLKGVLCVEFKVTLPLTVEVMRGSCVTIPCSFEIETRFNRDLDGTCEAIWKNANTNEVVFQSSESNKNKGELKGNLREKDCTTTLNTVSEHRNKRYYFRLECKNALKYNFNMASVGIAIIDNLPSPTLTPSTLNVKEGSSVSLTCSAPAICPSHPPTLRWTPKLGESQETLRENQDKTKVKTSVHTFTASHLHHGQKISCTAVYKKLDGRTNITPERSVTAFVSYSPKDTRVSVSPSGPVPENSNVTLTCSSDANPPVKNYTWYRADGDQEAFIGTGRVLNIEASKVKEPFFCKATNDLGVGRSSNKQIDVQYPPKNTTASVSPSGPVPENSNVTLTCSSDANPPVKNYTWYRADGDQEAFIGTGHVLNIEASKVKEPFFCKATNDLGVGRSSNKQIDVQYGMLLPVFITTVVILFPLVCVLLFLIRFQRNHNKSPPRGEIDTDAPAQHPIRGGNEVPNTTEDDIYVNTRELRQDGVTHPAIYSELDGTNLSSSGANNAEEVSKSSGKNGEDVIYSSVNWMPKSKKKRRQSLTDMDPSGGSYMEEEKRVAGRVCGNFSQLGCGQRKSGASRMVSGIFGSQGNACL